MAARAAGRLPDFLVIGTQKAGTTWILRKLDAHPNVFMAPRQLHFFDREFHRGLDWYRAQFAGAGEGQLAGEKTTEYFDTATIDTVSMRIAETCPDCKLMVILRNPVDRAWSAQTHHVNVGRVPLPADPQSAVFDHDTGASGGTGHFRFIERGFYARQLRTLYDRVDPSRVLVLVFEDDIVARPERGWAKACSFLGLPEAKLMDASRPENQVRLSPIACRLSFLMRRVPKARGALRRIDGFLGMKPWAPKMTPDTRERLQRIYEKPNRELFDLIGRDVDSWRSPS